MMKRFPLLVFLLYPMISWGTIAGVQCVNATGGGSNASSVTFSSSAITAGNYVAIAIATNLTNIFKVTPGSAEKDWVLVHYNYGYNSTGTLCVTLWVYKVITGGQTSIVAATVPATSGPMSGVLREYSVCSGCNLVPDVWRSSATGNSTSPLTSTTDTTNVANELLIAIFGTRAQSSSNTNQFSAPTNSFTFPTNGGASSTFNTSNSDRAVGLAEQIVTSTGTYSAGATGPSNQWAAAISAFKEVPQVVSRMSGE